jgi:hypothetical protein
MEIKKKKTVNALGMIFIGDVCHLEMSFCRCRLLCILFCYDVRVMHAVLDPPTSFIDLFAAEF